MKRKKVISLICIVAMSASLLACGGSEELTTTNDYKDVSTSTQAIATPSDTASTQTTDTPKDTASIMPETSTDNTSSYYSTDSSEASMDIWNFNGIFDAEMGGGDFITEEFNTEEYNYTNENGFKDVSTSPLSTFAADVDTGSYTNFRRMIYDNYFLEDIPQGAIRTEEMINYFDYEVADTDDDNRFAISYETNTCPWNEDNQLLMLTVKAQDVELNSSGNNFVFLIDSSGSMSSTDKGALAIKSFKLLAETLNENDRVSIVTYSGSSEVILESCSGENFEKICNALDSIEFGGGTYGSGGITAAYELAAENFMEGGNNRVIIASDGDMNLGITSNAGLTDLISEKKETGVFLTVLGYGDGNYSDANMESIADHGNGNYYYIDCLDEANRVLVDKLKQTTVTVAKDVKLQVEFNPLEVSEYRLLGYENRTMAAEDFEDDTKDGGETGAGQTVTVLYELICNDENANSSDLKYQTDRDLTDDAMTGELLTLSIRYKEPDENQSVEESFIVKASENTDSDMSADFAFIAGVAELAMILNDSDYIGTADLDSAYELVQQGTAENKYREELAEIIQTLNY